MPYDEATLFDLVLYDYDKAKLSNELPAALEVAAGLGNRKSLYDCILLRIRHLPRS
jgi:hypothetical protein